MEREMNRIRSSKEKREAAATAPRLVLWQRSINSSSISLEKDTSTYAAVYTDSENEADIDTSLTNWLHQTHQSTTTWWDSIKHRVNHTATMITLVYMNIWWEIKKYKSVPKTVQTKKNVFNWDFYVMQRKVPDKDPQAAGYKGEKYVVREAGYFLSLTGGLSNSR